MSKFPMVLADLRDRNGLTQAQLGESVGLSRSTISMYELGQRIPDLPTLEKLADFFNVDLDTLAGRKPLKLYITIEEQELLKQLSNKEQKELLMISRDANPSDVEMIKGILKQLKSR